MLFTKIADLLHSQTHELNYDKMFTIFMGGYCETGRDEAAAAAAYGLDPAAALAAITLAPAQIIGVADRVGSLEVGKDASLFLCDG